MFFNLASEFVHSFLSWFLFETNNNITKPHFNTKQPQKSRYKVWLSDFYLYRYIKVELSNLFSLIGALLLLIAYMKLTIKGDEVLGFKLSAFGSGFMAASFYLCEGHAFFAFNLIWVTISIMGYRNRQSTYRLWSVSVPPSWVDLILIPLMVSGAIASVMGYLYLSSWLVVALLLSAYFLFASKSITKSAYILTSMVASICSLRYLEELGNYPSLIQTMITIALSIWSLLYSKSRFDDGSAQ